MDRPAGNGTGARQDALLEQYARLVPETARQISARAAGDPDALQCGMIGLWEACMEWDGQRHFVPFARQCIRHNIIDCLRTRRPEEPLPVRDGGYEDPRIAALTGGSDLLPVIQALFPRRSRERRVLMSLLAGKSKRSIAERLGCSPRTVDRVGKRAWAQICAEREGRR